MLWGGAPHYCSSAWLEGSFRPLKCGSIFLALVGSLCKQARATVEAVGRHWGPGAGSMVSAALGPLPQAGWDPGEVRSNKGSLVKASQPLPQHPILVSPKCQVVELIGPRVGDIGSSSPKAWDLREFSCPSPHPVPTVLAPRLC